MSAFSVRSNGELPKGMPIHDGKCLGNVWKMLYFVKLALQRRFLQSQHTNHKSEIYIFCCFLIIYISMNVWKANTPIPLRVLQNNRGNNWKLCLFFSKKRRKYVFLKSLEFSCQSKNSFLGMYVIFKRFLLFFYRKKRGKNTKKTYPQIAI